MTGFVDIGLDHGCLRAAAAGDRSAQRRVYDQVAGPLFALIRRMVRDRAAAEDLFQDCMIQVLRHLSDYRGEAPLGSWVRQIALRQCLMHLRSPWQRARQVLHTAFDDESAADDALPYRPALVGPAPEDTVDLERALARLPDLTRTVLWLHDVEGLTHEEIAAGFGRSVSFSKSQLARAHALLRAQLADAAPTPVARPDIAAQGQLP